MTAAPIEVHVHVHGFEQQAPELSSTAIIKSDETQRYVLGVAYQAGPDTRIGTGADGFRDFIGAVALEKAAWGYIPAGARVNLFHDDGTEGHATVVESYIYRGPDWVIKDTGGTEVVVKAGDWLVGAILDAVAWSLVKAERVTGWSPQGTATRRTRRSNP